MKVKVRLQKRYIFIIFISLLFAFSTTYSATCTQLYGKKDYQSAIVQCAKEARHSSANASFIMGQIFSQGLGVSKNQRKAMIYYHQAVLKNNINSQIALGKLYASNKHYLKSHIFFSLASENGEPAALNYKNEVEQQLSMKDISISKDFLNVVKDAINQQKNEQLAIK